MATAFYITLVKGFARPNLDRRIPGQARFRTAADQGGHPAGFTLIELLISIAIFSIITGIMAWNFDRNHRNENILHATENLAADMRLVQNMAMTGALIKGPDDPSEAIPRGGYGIHFDLTNRSEYHLFADREKVNDDLSCSPIRNGRFDFLNGTEGCWNNGSNDDLQVDDVQRLPKDVEIESIAVDWWDEPEPINIVDIAFVPPKPIPTVGVNALANEAKIGTVTINLIHRVTLAERRITLIGASGQVSITTPAS